MRLYLIRHAEAVDSPPGARFLDDLRALTPRGDRRFRRTARAFAKLGEPIAAVRSSPAQLERAPVAVLDELHPNVAAVVLRDWLLSQSASSIALVGHGRQLRDLARLLIGPELPFTLKKGCIIRIDLRGKQAVSRWRLRDREREV